MAEARRIEQVVNGAESTPTGKHGVGGAAQQACHACACPFLSSLLTPALCWHLFSPMKTLALFRAAAGCSRALTSTSVNAIVWRSSGAMALARSEEHTAELQSLMRISYAVFCLKKKIKQTTNYHNHTTHPYTNIQTSTS